MLFCTAFRDFMFLAGAFNWTWFFHFGKLGRMTRHFGPGVTRIWRLLLGGVMTIFILGGSWDDRPLDQRLWPVNGPTIETPEPSEPHPPLQMPRSYPQETWAPP